jgi:endonuclease/exonuclease/phosphatase family metal-dependent hydrolase
VIVRRLVDEGFVDALGVSGNGRRTSKNHEHPLDWIFVQNIAPRTGRVIEVQKASDYFPLEAALSPGSRLPLATK